MAHETRTQPDSVWVDNYQVERSDLESLDAKQFRSLNGVRGGCWAPEEKIIINGPLDVTGPTEVRGSGVLRLGFPGEVVLADDDWPELLPGHAGRTRRFVQSTLPFVPVGPHPWCVGVSFQHASAQPIALTIVDSQGVEWTPEFLIPLRVHNGATLDRVTFFFRVPELRRRAPEAMPRFRVFRVDAEGNADEMKSTELGDGFASPINPGSAQAWFKAGDAHEFVYECDQNNVIDVSKYRYFAHVVEETGAADFPARVNAFTQSAVRMVSRAPVTLSSTTGQTFIDGDQSFVAGENPQPDIILKDQVNPSENGLWRAGATASALITRSANFNDDHKVEDGTIFPAVSVGHVNGSTAWQISLPTPFLLGISPIRFAPPVPRGNIYHSARLDFSGITDLRWQ